MLKAEIEQVKEIARQIAKEEVAKALDALKSTDPAPVVEEPTDPTPGKGAKK